LNIHRMADNVLVKVSFNTAITAASNNGSSVDTYAHGGPFRRVAATFATSPSGTGTTSDCKLQESSDNSTWADVTSANFTQGTTAGGSTVQWLDVDMAKGRKRYLRLVHTGAGASAAGQAVGLLYLFEAADASPTQDVAAVAV
jgi:hypothetical protein